jgi:hypothetical protein
MSAGVVRTTTWLQPLRRRRAAAYGAVLTRLGVHVRVVKGQWADDTPGAGTDPADGFGCRPVE